MSTARFEHMRRRAESGFTFLEVTIVLVLISLMALVIERTIASTSDAETYLRAIRRATERGQRLAFEIRDEVTTSRKLFQNDVTGQDYFGILDLSRDPVDTTARLPLTDDLGVIGEDAPGDPRTGNILLFVRESDAAPAVAMPSTGKVRFIDTYRFICIYPSLTSQFVLQDAPRRPAKDLIVWRSEAYPSHSQIMAITSLTERQNVVADLYNRFGYDLAWDPNGTVDAAYYALDAIGNVAPSPTTGVVINEDINLSDRGRLVYTNTQLARSDQSSPVRKNVFTNDPPASWVPDGFTVKFVGVSGSRKVWMRLVVEVQAAKGRVAPHGSTLIASTQDL